MSHLHEAAALAGAVQVVGQAAGLVVAPQGGPFLPTGLALDHAAPPDRIRQPCQLTMVHIYLRRQAEISQCCASVGGEAVVNVDLCMLAWFECSRADTAWA